MNFRVSVLFPSPLCSPPAGSGVGEDKKKRLDNQVIIKPFIQSG